MTQKRSLVTHSLTNIDPAEMAGDCAVCGTQVPIQRVSPKRDRFACRTARREARKHYREAHPDRVRADKASRRKGSMHRVTRGVCCVCGPVETVIHRRGSMCANRAAELGWKGGEPQGRCVTCHGWMRNDGSCPACDDRAATDLGYALMLDEYGTRVDGPVYIEDGSFVIEAPLSTGIENAVPGWKTIGATE